MAARWETVFVQGYGRLVRAAYMVDAGHPSRQARLWRAHRLVQRSLPLWSGQRIAANVEDGYPALLARVLRRAMRRPLWAVRVTARSTPGGLDPLGGPEHGTVDQILARLDRQVRVAYVLLIAEDLNRRSATSVLQVVGASDPHAAVSGACRVRDQLAAEHGLDPARQSAILDDPALNPTLASVGTPASIMLRTLRVGRGVLGGLATMFVLVAVVTLATRTSMLG